MGAFLFKSSYNLPPVCTHCGSYAGVLTPIPSAALPVSLLRSRYVPDSSECSDIRALVASCKTAIRTLETELSNLNHHITNILAYKNMHHSLLAPIRRLPDDILRHIFEYACEETINIGFANGQIWNLRQVCFDWRNTVDNTPLFWNKFNMTGTPEVDMDLITHRIHSCLELSRTAPLDICLINIPTRRSPSLAVEDLINHADRWVSLTIDVSLLESAAGTIEARGLAQLRKLSVHGMERSSTSLHMFRNATAIEELELNFDIFPDDLEIPLANVKKFTIKDCIPWPGDIFYSTIRSLSFNLKELIWIDSALNLELVSDIIILPSLDTFSYEGNFKYLALSRIWDILCVPSLVNLNIRDEDSYDITNASVNPLLAMLQRSSCVVKRLQLDLASATAALYILEAFPDVEDLSLLLEEASNCLMLISELVWHPIRNPGISAMLPSLRILNLCIPICGNPVYDISSIMDLIRSRSSTASSMTENQMSRPQALSFLKYIAAIRYDCCKGNIAPFEQLKELGRELGISVEIELKDVDVQNGTESSSSSI